MGGRSSITCAVSVKKNSFWLAVGVGATPPLRTLGVDTGKCRWVGGTANFDVIWPYIGFWDTKNVGGACRGSGPNQSSHETSGLSTRLLQSQWRSLVAPQAARVLRQGVKAPLLSQSTDMRDPS